MCNPAPALSCSLPGTRHPTPLSPKASTQTVPPLTPPCLLSRLHSRAHPLGSLVSGQQVGLLFLRRFLNFMSSPDSITGTVSCAHILHPHCTKRARAVYHPTRFSLVCLVPSTEPGIVKVSRKAHPIKLTLFVLLSGRQHRLGHPALGWSHWLSRSGAQSLCLFSPPGGSRCSARRREILEVA